MGLLGYVGLVTERSVRSILRGRRYGERGYASLTSDDESGHDEVFVDASEGPESRYAARESAAHVLSVLRASTSEKGVMVLEMSIVEGRPIEAICEALGMSEESVYAWRSRLLKRAEGIARELEAEPTWGAG